MSKPICLKGLSLMWVARNEKGAVMVEFALVLPLLVLLVFGFLKSGLAMNGKIDSTHLTAEGARYVAVNQNPSDPPVPMEEYIRARAATAELQQAIVCISYPVNPETSTSGKVGDPVRVTMNHTYSIIPLLGELPVASQTTMRIEARDVQQNIPAACTS